MVAFRLQKKQNLLVGRVSTPPRDGNPPHSAGTACRCDDHHQVDKMKGCLKHVALTPSPLIVTATCVSAAHTPLPTDTTGSCASRMTPQPPSTSPRNQSRCSRGRDDPLLFPLLVSHYPALLSFALRSLASPHSCRRSNNPQTLLYTRTKHPDDSLPR